MFAKFKALIDSSPFVIFFAVWTGVYLAQILKGEISLAKGGSVADWIIGALIFALVFF